MADLTGTYTKVNFAQMERVTTQFLRIITALDKETDDLMKNLEAKLGASWEGPVKEYFEGHRRLWDQKEKEMAAKLGEARKALGIASENYQAAEARNRAMWETP
ncbi:WXG100 family type VII secretion target [Nonomuraea typhae]|uniref:WXG100 family type VII secretion target n=1 Tax=Nonomuraea typhae TaxID=2603600 RepID=UPI0012F890F1|nr:WXG100 family type VII secretion target [Nonomuraea typhae]